MSDIFKAELFRFRYWALTYFLIHGAVIAFFGRVTDLLQQGPMVVQGVAAAYGLTGLLLGLYQMGGYRRANRWLNLIHRPVPPHKIALALVAAGAALLAVSLIFPWLLLLSAQEFMSSRVVDLRHWLLPVAILFLGVAGYLAGCYAVLGVRRYAPLVLILPALLAFSNAAGTGAIAIEALVTAWLLYLVMTAFKPDLDQTPHKLPALVLIALPVQMAIFLLLLSVGGIAFQLGWIMLGTHPLNSIAPRGGFVEATRAEGRQLIADALGRRTDPQARLWREQASISDTFKVQPAFDQLPIRGELTNTVPIEFSDEERQVIWTFSHDNMRFEGRSSADGRPHGRLGHGEEGRPFDRPPVTIDDGTLVDASRISNFDTELELILPRLQVPAGETIAAPPVSVGESIALLSDKAIYFYDGEVLRSDDREFPARQRVPLVRKIGNLERVDIMELLNGYLVSETFGRGAPDGAGDPEHFLLETDGAGHVTTAAHRLLSHDFSAMTRFQGEWLSPVLNEAYYAAINLFAPHTPLTAHDGSRPPTSIWITALFLAVLAAIGTWWWTGHVKLGRKRRAGWTAASAIVGLPAVASLVLFHPRSADRS